MYSRFSVAAASVAGLLVATSAFAKPDVAKVSVTNARSGTSISIPAHAVQVAPDVFSLGEAVVDGKKVEGMMYVHRKSNAKPDGVGGGKPGGGGATCYSFLAKGAKWKTAEPWVLNPANNFDMHDADLLQVTSAVISEWENAAGADILGNGMLTNATLVADVVSPDNVNEIYFGTIDEPGVIAVTITWGVFGGNPNKRSLVEMDQVFDQTDFNWSVNQIAPTGMDYENISQHEIGHGIGMGHTPTTAECVNETMYPYAADGEVSKRDLGPGDVAGIAELY